VPECQKQKRALTARIIALCGIRHGTRCRADAFDDLQARGQNAPQALLGVVTDAEIVTARLRDSARPANYSWASFRRRHISSIAGNPDRAAKLLEFVGTAGSTARRR
jgi:hypothetical protein